MSGKFGGGAPKCPGCNKSVYFNEQTMALDKPWHNRCLKCAQCSKVLEPGNFSDRQGKLYCKFCYSSVAGLKGYGHGHHNESHVSGGAAGVSAGSEVITTPGIEGGVSGNAAPAAAGAVNFCSNCGARASGNFCSGCGNKI
eukprot:TRINITY_DN2722_c0_g1_i1.p2 TRINITY_DN2722_c0_g1~~TRINITY_DN2722_c0_g1_i1.p2  ORF type:complete len:141 (+),score=26.65 TRINITY_DN2722_c0_g1_i1:44-466(+)